MSKISESLNKHGITIEQKISNVTEYREIDIDSIGDKLNTKNVKYTFIDSYHDESNIEFNILQCGDIIFESVTEKELQSFIKKLVEDDEMEVKSNTHRISGIIRIFENFLDDKNITIKNNQRDSDDKEDPNSIRTNIYGDDYYRLENDLIDFFENNK